MKDICDQCLFCFTAPNDYSSKHENISIQQGFKKQCISVNISNDNVSERVEYFSLILTSEESRLTLNPNTTTVSILDDDSKLTISIILNIV